MSGTEEILSQQVTTLPSLISFKFRLRSARDAIMTKKGKHIIFIIHSFTYISLFLFIHIIFRVLLVWQAVRMKVFRKRMFYLEYCWVDAMSEDTTISKYLGLQTFLLLANTNYPCVQYKINAQLFSIIRLAIYFKYKNCLFHIRYTMSW